MTDSAHGLAGLFTRNRHLLILSLVMILVAGSSALLSLPRIEDPRITTRNATIITQFPGASAERIEAQVSKPIEDELRELAEIKTIESTSRRGISVIGIELQDRIGRGDNDRVFAEVRDRLDAAAARLPAGAGRPVFDDMRGAVAYSLILSVSWRQGEETRLGTLQRVAEQLGDRLRNLPGTEQVVLFGGVDEEVHVDIDAIEAAAAGMSAAADARRSAGTLHTGDLDLALELRGELDSTARIAAIPLRADSDGAQLRVGDIASVHKRWRDPPDSIALHEGRRSVLVAVRTERDVRLDNWSAMASDAVAGFGATLDDAVLLDNVFEQSRYTSARLGELSGNLLAGAGVVMLVVWLMMGWRPALIVGPALPLSAGLTLFGLTFFDEQIHQMTIFGMIIAIGLLIDNAIVMTDRIVASRRAGMRPVAAVVDAINHLFTPLFASTLTTVLGFMPVFLLPGNIGDFVGPIAVAVVLALIASFALSMTVIPALAGLFAHTGGKTGRRWWHSGISGSRMTPGYRRLLHRVLDRPLPSLVLIIAVPLAGFAAASTLGMQFFPPADRDQLEVQLWMPAGSGIRATSERVAAIETVIRRQPGTETVSWVVGASSPPVYYNQLRTQDSNPGYARGIIRLRDAATANRVEAELQRLLDDRFTDVQVVVRAFGQGPPISAPVEFRIVGPDPERLRVLGEGLRALLHRDPAITHTQASIEGGEPKLWLDADEREAQLAGLTLGGIAEHLQAALDGNTGGIVLEDLESLPVRIRYAADERQSLDRLATQRLDLPGTADWLPASALGEFDLQPTLQAITRRNGERSNTISAYLRQGALPIEVTGRMLEAIDAGALALPPGYRVVLAGDSAEQRRAVGQLLTYVPVLATLMIATLVLSFRSFALAGLIGLVALLAVGLGMLSLWAGGYPLGFNPIIGSAGLIGVAINGSIVVLAAIRANPLARAGDSAAIIDETVGATRHIVATTLTTVGGFMPLLLFSGGAFWPPLAIVIAGGVGLSGLLSLLLTPLAYHLLYANRNAQRQYLPPPTATRRA